VEGPETPLSRATRRQNGGEKVTKKQGGSVTRLVILFPGRRVTEIKKSLSEKAWPLEDVKTGLRWDPSVMDGGCCRSPREMPLDDTFGRLFASLWKQPARWKPIHYNGLGAGEGGGRHSSKGQDIRRGGEQRCWSGCGTSCSGQSERAAWTTVSSFHPGHQGALSSITVGRRKGSDGPDFLTAWNKYGRDEQELRVRLRHVFGLAERRTSPISYSFSGDGAGDLQTGRACAGAGRANF